MIDKIYSNNIEEEDNFACLFSGGKDSALAFAIACEHGNPISLIHVYDNNISYYHDQKIDVIKEQSVAMGTPLYLLKCDMKKREYLHHLARVLKDMKDKGVNCFITGTMYDIHTFNIYSTICNCLNIKLKFPLWNLPDEKILELIEYYNIQSIITKINDSRISKTWLGKVYNKSVYEYFKSIHIHPFGEYDEFHTTLIDAGFFKKIMAHQANLF